MNKDNWISVLDELPNDFDRVLLWSDKFNRESVGYFLLRDDGLFIQYDSTLAFVGTLDRKITHWKKIPSPPTK